MHPPLNHRQCWAFYVWRLINCQCVLTGVDLILILRGDSTTCPCSFKFLIITPGVSACAIPESNHLQRVDILSVRRSSSFGNRLHCLCPRGTLYPNVLDKHTLKSCHYIWVGVSVPVLNYSSQFHHRVFALSLQGAILFFTLRKHIKGRRSGWSRTPILSLLIRDGAVAFVIVTGELAQFVL
jgi:hypothetical protein